MAKKRTKNLSEPAIEVDASTMTGMWNVSFRTEPKGFSAWLTVGSGIPEPVKTHMINEPLTWRVAAEVLADMFEDGLQGDRVSGIIVRGVEGWQAEILKMAAITAENPFYESFQILLEFNDPEIREIFERFGSLLTSEAKTYLHENWGEVYDDVGIDPNCEELYSDLEAITKSPSPSTIEERMELLSQWVESLEKPKRNLSSNVSWEDEREWFSWLLSLSQNDLLWVFYLRKQKEAEEVASWLRHMVALSERQIDHSRKYGNQASQIGIGLMRRFVSLASENLATYDRLKAEHS